MITSHNCCLKYLTCCQIYDKLYNENRLLNLFIKLKKKNALNNTIYCSLLKK